MFLYTKHLLSELMKKPSIKKLLSYLILFSFACGPSLDFSEYFSILYPEAAENPIATESYFFSNDVLAKQYFMNSSAYLADSLNLESWYHYVDKKISKKDIKTGLYNKDTGEELANQLTGIGKTEAANYVLLAQEIDKEVLKFPTDWETTEPVNEQLLGDAREMVLVQLASLTIDDFLIERYAFQGYKIDAKLDDWSGLIKDYQNFQSKVKNKSFISEWSQSRYAGALLKSGETAKGILEFAKVFQTSPTRRNQADLSIRHLSNLDFKKALEISKTKEEKLAVMALQAIQPHQDGLKLLQSMAEIDPNYQMLELVMAREINKNEVNFYAEKNAGSYTYDLDIYDDNYKIDSNKVDAIKTESLGYFADLLMFNESLVQNEGLAKKAFWLTTAAYLNYIKGDMNKMKSFLTRAENEKNINNNLTTQIKVFKALHFLENANIKNDEKQMLEEIKGLKVINGFRDSNVLTFLSSKLQKKYINQADEVQEKSGWLSSCYSSKEESPKVNSKIVKAFLAEHIPAEKEDYALYSNTFSEAQLFKDADAKTLKATLDFINQNTPSSEDALLIELAGINIQELMMAYGRKLVRMQAYEEALAVFKSTEDPTLMESPFASYFSPLPNQFIGNELMDETLLNPIIFLENAVLNQKNVDKKPKDARAWYQLGLAAYNMSYWGNGWLFSDREWSSMEILYGETTDEDYFTNAYAKECFEKALAANPDPELGAQICYMGALCEKNQYYLAYAKGKPNTYNPEELNRYDVKMTKGVLPTFQSFFRRLKKQYDDTQYESQVIKECMSYVEYKLK
ncbi:MAG: hypothetical protein ACI8UX_001958 [Psychromonas sp.]|jgi:hypothetical protein